MDPWQLFVTIPDEGMSNKGKKTKVITHYERIEPHREKRNNYILGNGFNPEFTDMFDLL